MEKIPVLVLFIITLLANPVAGITRTYFSKNVSQTVAGYHLFNAVSSLVCGVTLLLLSGGDFRLSSYTLLMAVLFGLVTAAQQVITSAALSIGPWSYTSVIVSMSTVITALSGALFFNEIIRTTQIIGILLMMGCLILSVKKEEGDQKKKTMRWFALCMLACAFCGGVGIMQKVHQSSAHREELTMFLVIAFLCSFVFSTCSIFVQRWGKNGKKEPFIEKKISATLLVVLFVAGGVGTALINQINLYLSGVVDSAIFFPIVNGGGLIMITILSLVFFKERLTKLQWVGMALGAAATLLLCL